MGHSARKRKKRGGAGRKAGKDHAAQLDGDQTALTDELTALAAIFLEDFKVTSESPHTRFSICIRPYSDGMGFGDLNVSAILDVTCFAGYPHKCPKLRIIPEKNLSKEDADRLLSLLVDQAPHLVSDTIHQTTDANAKVSLDNGPYPGISYIYNSFDLFSQLYDDNSWQRQGFDPTTDSARKTIGSPVQSNVRSKRKTVDEKSRFSADKINAAKSSSRDNAEQHAIKHGSKREVVPSLHVVAEETDNDSKTLSTSNGGGMSDTPDRSSSSVHEPEDSDLEDEAWNDEGSDSGSSNARNKKRDLILVHLLRLACASKDSLSAALPEISSELCNIGVLSEWAKELISESPAVFGETFDHVFGQQMAWVETEYGHHHVLNTGASRTAESSLYSFDDISLSDAGAGNKQESTYLYIQMEYCPRTLRQDFETYSSSFNVDHAWHLFRQIVEGLAHVHSQGIIHRDLTPSNIFFDVRNDIKIGDFGLAKFLKLEQLDHDLYLPTEATGVSMDGTGQVGTYFYTAPEVEQKWPQINEKVDMYSAGVIFFELWHPFSTAMERHLVLTDLKLKGDPPVSWATQFPGQSVLLRRLVCPSPSERPSAVDLLQNELPPRMEDEWLNDVLRMIQTPEDTYVYDRVISTIFNEDRLVAKMQSQHESSKKSICKNDNSELLDSIIEISSCKRYEISWVHRRAVGHSTPFRFLQNPSIKVVFISSFQGDFDIIGGSSPITEAEVIKVALDLVRRFYDSKAIVIRLNHSKLAEAVCSWAGVPQERRQNVAEFLSSTLVQYCPNKADRKSQWSFIRGQLLQIYSKEGNPVTSSDEKLMAVGGRYDMLMEQAWDKTYKTKSPGAVGVSIALEKFLPNNPASDVGLPRIEHSISVLVCSKGGGGLLNERMELVAELWEANIKAQFVPQEDPSLQEQYEYASDHDIKCLVFITEGLSQTDLVKVRHLDAKREKEVKREDIVKWKHCCLFKLMDTKLIHACYSETVLCIVQIVYDHSSDNFAAR
ncbi:hypothetical protein ACQ4PT_013200 [Festuca glaucescens]